MRAAAAGSGGSGRDIGLLSQMQCERMPQLVGAELPTRAEGHGGLHGGGTVGEGARLHCVSQSPSLLSPRSGFVQPLL